MSAERSRADIPRFIEELSHQGDFEAVGRWMDPDYAEAAFPPNAPPGGKGLKQYVRMLRAGFPDFWYEIDELVAEGR